MKKKVHAKVRLTRRRAGAWWDKLTGKSATSAGATPLILIKSAVSTAYFMVAQVISSGDVRTLYPTPAIRSDGNDLIPGKGPIAPAGEWIGLTGEEAQVILVRPNHADARKALTSHAFQKSTDFELIAYDSAQNKYFTCSLNSDANTFQITDKGIIKETTLNAILKKGPSAPLPKGSSDVLTNLAAANGQPPLSGGGSRRTTKRRAAGGLFSATPTFGIWNRTDETRFDGYQGYTTKEQVSGGGSSRVFDYTAQPSFELPSPASTGGNNDVVQYLTRLPRKGLTIDRELVLIANDSRGVKSISFISVSSANAVYCPSTGAIITDTIKDPKLSKALSVRAGGGRRGNGKKKAQLSRMDLLSQRCARGGGFGPRCQCDDDYQGSSDTNDDD